MKNKFISLPIVITFILGLLISGCASRNPAQQVNLPAGQSQVEKVAPASEATNEVLKVHFIDVGQGDAILVQTPTGQNMLVDAGENDYGDAVANYLTAQGVKSLEVVVGTHPHSDHIGGLDTIVNRFPVKYLYLPKATNTTQSYRDLLTAVKNTGLQVITAQAGVVLPLEGVDGRFLAPVTDTYAELNDYSAVIRLQYGSQSFLLTGDAGTLPEAQMLDSGANLKATVLKVAHHGSYSSSSSSFLAVVSPQYGVIMLGAGNDYGYPHSSTINRLAKAGIKLFRTDQNGTIVFTTDGNTMQVRTER